MADAVGDREYFLYLRQSTEVTVRGIPILLVPVDPLETDLLCNVPYLQISGVNIAKGACCIALKHLD